MKGLIGLPTAEGSTRTTTLARLPGGMLETVPVGVSAARSREAKWGCWISTSAATAPPRSPPSRAPTKPPARKILRLRFIGFSCQVLPGGGGHRSKCDEHVHAPGGFAPAQPEHEDESN